MLFGFFLRTNKSFRLASRPYPLNDFPQFCSRGSKVAPHLLSPINQIIPQITYTDEIKPKTFIPLFVAMRKGDNMIINPSSEKSESFCLIFYPNPDEPPVSQSKLVEEYWSSIEPMIICRDVSGYYLGSANDPNIIFFETCPESEAECWLARALSGYDPSTCYGTDIQFYSEKIFLRKVNTRK